MESSNWIAKYNQLNNSFSKTLVFRVGIQAGLFSEINHLFLAVLFCLKNKIRFVLSSRDNNFAYAKGWDDYFLPFCEESDSKLHLKYNARSYQIQPTIPNIIKTKAVRKILGVDFLTQDIWTYLRDAKFQNETFDFPELSISGNLVNALAVAVNNIWQFQPEIKRELDHKIATLQLPLNFIGVHLRGGDKATEAKISPIHDYMNCIRNVTDINNLFILTDDYKYIYEIEEKYPEYKTYTFCEQNEKGFSEAAYNQLNKADKKSITIKMLANTEVLYKSAAFVGTMSSNVGLFVGIRKNAKNWYNIDANNWRMW